MTAVLLGRRSALFLQRTPLGVQMRAAAENFRMARLLGVRGEPVIAAAFAISGLLAGVAALLLVAQGGTVTPTIGADARADRLHRDVIGGLGQPARRGARRLPPRRSDGRRCRWCCRSSCAPTATRSLYAVVILVLVVRPQGLRRRRSAQARV